MAEKLELGEKLYDFALYMYPVFKRYPKSETHALAKETKKCITDMRRAINKANKSTTARKSAMYDADLFLEDIRFHVRLAKDLHYIDLHRYGVICEKLAEIGKLLGGWIAWAQAQGKTSTASPSKSHGTR